VFGTGRPIAALHGFTLTGAQFEPLSHAGMEIHAPDLPGHGATVVDPVDPATTIGVLGEWLASFDEPIPLLGYSQGGRMALLAALEYPKIADRLILISASPGIRDEGQRAERRAGDEALAQHIEAVGIDVFLDEWLTGPITGTAHLDEVVRRRDRLVRMENTARGLASALRGIGQGSQPYVGSRLGDLAMPLLTVSGRADDRYGRLAGEMASASPNGIHRSIEHTGHNVVLEAPDELANVVFAFLDD
jgi:2-succinyl-6-hydroxy-2,4-cyclohexadiene-1-carboxylate synthase